MEWACSAGGQGCACRGPACMPDPNTCRGFSLCMMVCRVCEFCGVCSLHLRKSASERCGPSSAILCRLSVRTGPAKVRLNISGLGTKPLFRIPRDGLWPHTDPFLPLFACFSCNTRKCEFRSHMLQSILHFKILIQWYRRLKFIYTMYVIQVIRPFCSGYPPGVVQLKYLYIHKSKYIRSWNKALVPDPGDCYRFLQDSNSAVLSP